MTEYIIVIHSNTSVRDQLIFALAREGWLVTAPATSEAVRRQVRQYGPPALLVCAAEPAAPDPAEALAELKARARTRVLGIWEKTPKEIQQEEQQALGEIDDFLLWPAPDAEILLRVRRLVVPRHASPAPGLHFYSNGNQPAPPPAWVGHSSQNEWETAALSPVECEIMGRLTAAEGEVISAATLAETISAQAPERQINTLRVHISRLRKKLELDPRQPRYILTVRNVGYRLSQDSACRPYSPGQGLRLASTHGSGRKDAEKTEHR